MLNHLTNNKEGCINDAALLFLYKFEKMFPILRKSHK